ncbi:MAG: hypothetical protein CL843_07360, partial [Crocinitomicaceae bacterium]|nr:hypothetical protein [Crocinitomicaceae bacterium]
ATDTVTQPDVLAAAITIDSTVSCAGLSDGGATVTVTGGTMPYAYSWTNGDSTASITGVPADIYGVTVTDTNGCIAFAFDTVSQPAVLVISLDSVMDANCKGDSTGYASVSAMGGTMPYAYSWTSGDTGTTVSTLPEGTFTVTVMDSNNCSADTSFTIGYIHELPIVDLGDDVDTNIAEVTIALPDTFVTYLWSTGSDSNAITVYEKGTFSVIVTDSNGCSNSDSIYISLWPSSVVDRGDAGAGVFIYPNPTQGVFTLETINLNEERLDWMIVNINGQIIEQGVMNSNVQQQQIDLSESAQGVYFLIGKTSTNSFTTRIVVQ